MIYRLINADVIDGLSSLPDESVQCVVTSPPYWGLRDYGVEGQIGLEPTPDAFVSRLVDVFREVRRVLRDDGTLWLNLGDSYAMTTRGAGGNGKQHTNAGSVLADRNVPLPAGLKAKDLIGIPWRVAFALQGDGWYLRSDIIWHKPNPMPESVTDRPTKAHEYLFLLTKSARYYYDAEAIKEPIANGTIDRFRYSHQYATRAHREGVIPQSGGIRPDAVEEPPESRNKRSVWTVATAPFPEAHFATFPPDLIEPCILAGSSVGDTVLDPFNGSGTTGVVALGHQRNYVGIELNPEYVAMARRRLANVAPMFATEQIA